VKYKIISILVISLLALLGAPVLYGQAETNFCITGICLPAQEKEQPKGGLSNTAAESHQIHPAIRESSVQNNISSFGNKCTNLPISAVKVSGNTLKGLPSYASDGNRSSYWANKDKGSVYELDLGSEKNICGIQIVWPYPHTRLWNFAISLSNDTSNNSNYLNVYTGRSIGNITGPQTYHLQEILAKDVRVTLNGNNKSNYGAIAEINVFGR
jgi:F5/8 type C domain